MKLTLFSAVMIAAIMLSANDFKSVRIDANDISLMAICLNDTVLLPSEARYITRDLKDGATGTRLKIYKNQKFGNYSGKAGAMVGKGNRFWMLGGTGTVNNKKFQTVATVITGVLNADGTLQDMKEVRSLPYPARLCRALIHENKIYVLGGTDHNDLVFAEILDNGELGEWKTLAPYPVNVAEGGFVFYKGCFYANGRSTWKPGSSKMYAVRVKKDGTTEGKWRQIESPSEAQGYMAVHNDALYYFDTVSGNVYKTVQEEDGLQVKEWEVAGKMPCPPKTMNVGMFAVPGGWIFFGGSLPRKSDNKFAGFFKGKFYPASILK